MSLRILGGSAKGRVIQVPESARPSGARVRKSLFDMLASRAPEGRFPQFLDLHGGSGAIGLEAASRGYQVTLVDKEARAVRTLEQNARHLQVRVKVIRGDSEALLDKLGRFDIVYCDPPYDQDIPALTQKILESPVVHEGGVLICQHPRQVILPENQAYEQQIRKQGSNTLTLYWRVKLEV